jgi:acetyl-CoA carboxylase biotin carboxyl carrier protein
MARITVKSEIAGKVWKVIATAGQSLAEEDPIVILESMKMEIPVQAPLGCRLIEIVVNEGDSVAEGDIIAHIET